MTEHKKKVYLAGPDVFEKNAVELGKQYVKAAKERDLIGLYPLDNTVDFNKKTVDYEIFKLNKELLDSADYVVANLNDFRGKEPDSGTVWEVAYAIGRGKKVVGYLQSDETILERIAKDEKVTKEDQMYFDKDGKIIENFGNSLNLMLEHSLAAVIYGTIEDALDEISVIVKQEKNPEKFKVFYPNDSDNKKLKP